MLTVLRSLALLDEAFTINLVSLLEKNQRPNIDITKVEKPTAHVLPTLKRKVGYNNLEKMSEKRDKMVVDQPTSED